MTVILMKVKSCNALLRILLLDISGCLKSILRQKYLISDTYHPDTLYLRQQRCEDLWLFFEAKRGPRAKKFGKHIYFPFVAVYVNLFCVFVCQGQIPPIPEVPVKHRG